ncbi:hypothetical protein CHS0354_009855 [Potamilus streckersoni]|uniref:Uncharacterized protein n=1 Tax=Potamilus streckersoni TaxID=2493646 RepID=A0AAE0W3X0_9BIVA|nr:hypothetical protein CHS0354_009855 [Potamilus streckersoni]
MSCIDIKVWLRRRRLPCIAIKIHGNEICRSILSEKQTRQINLKTVAVIMKALCEKDWNTKVYCITGEENEDFTRELECYTRNIEPSISFVTALSMRVFSSVDKKKKKKKISDWRRSRQPIIRRCGINRRVLQECQGVNQLIIQRCISLGCDFILQPKSCFSSTAGTSDMCKGYYSEVFRATGTKVIDIDITLAYTHVIAKLSSLPVLLRSDCHQKRFVD